MKRIIAFFWITLTLAGLFTVHAAAAEDGSEATRQMRTDIARKLEEAFEAEPSSISIDPDDGSVTVSACDLFALGSTNLSDEGKSLLDRFVPLYEEVLFSEEYRDYIAEVRIDVNSDTMGDYATNLSMTQNRALSVLVYATSEAPDVDSTMHYLLRNRGMAFGRSFCNYVLNDVGAIDEEASNRVIFRFMLMGEPLETLPYVLRDSPSKPIQEEPRTQVDDAQKAQEGEASELEKGNALRRAWEYIAYKGFSKSGLVKQLEFDGFTHAAAEYAAENCGADWNQQAVRMAKAYLDYKAFSRSGLISQLEYEGFTHGQAEYGAKQNGY